MAGVQFITYKGIEIFYIDFSGITSKEDVLGLIEEAKTLITSRPPSSVFSLTNITGGFFDRDISQALKELAAHNKPYIKASAVIGITPIRRLVYNAIMFFSGRHIESCEDLESAKEWLLAQSKEQAPLADGRDS